MAKRDSLTKRDKQEILDLFSLNLNPQKIAKILGLNKKDVYDFLRKGGKKNV